FPAETLEETLNAAREFHDITTEPTESHRSLKEFADKLLSLRQTWETMPRTARGLVSYVGPPLPRGEAMAGALDASDILDVAGAIEHLYTLTTKRAEWLQGFRDGRLGKGRALQLVGLYTFTWHIKQFWGAHKKERFGCSFHGTGADCEPDNEPSCFLWACVQWLDRGYDAKQCQQCMRKVNRGERVGWQKQARGSGGEPVLTPEQIDSALANFLYTKRK
ncbi:MAG TPA: hypothetical protein VF178_09615, partial [Gemmatimonadaceae bacterium]